MLTNTVLVYTLEVYLITTQPDRRFIHESGLYRARSSREDDRTEAH